MMIKGHSRTSDSHITSSQGTLNFESQSPHRRTTVTTRRSTTLVDRDRMRDQHPARKTAPPHRKTAPPQIRLNLGSIEEFMTLDHGRPLSSHSRSGSEYSLLGEQMYSSPDQDKSFDDLLSPPPGMLPKCRGSKECEEGAGDVASAKVVRLSHCLIQRFNTLSNR